MGVKVHVVEMMPEILGAMDKETSGMLRAEYAKRGVTFYLNTKVVEVNAHGVVIEKEGKVSTIEAEKILLSVGRKANLSRGGLDKLNIELHRNGGKVDEHLLTSHPCVYACGDITGYSLLAHTAIREAEVAINHILGVEDRMNYDCVPGVVYTNPEVAGVGKTEEELIKSGLSTVCPNYRWLIPVGSVAENEQGNGLCKLIQDEEGRSSVATCWKSGVGTHSDRRYCYSERLYGGRISEDCIPASYGRRDLSRDYVLTLILSDL